MAKGYKILTATMNAPIGTFTYELGKTYTISGTLKVCSNGFHYARTIEDLQHYRKPGSRLFEIEASGKIEHYSEKDVCETIILTKELDYKAIFSSMDVAIEKEKTERLAKLKSMVGVPIYLKCVDIQNKICMLVIPEQGLDVQIVQFKGTPRLNAYYACSSEDFGEVIDVEKLIPGMPTPADILQTKMSLKL